MAGCFGNSKEDKSRERELNQYLDRFDDDNEKDEDDEEYDDGPSELDRADYEMDCRKDERDER